MTEQLTLAYSLRQRGLHITDIGTDNAHVHVTLDIQRAGVTEYADFFTIPSQYRKKWTRLNNHLASNAPEVYQFVIKQASGDATFYAKDGQLTMTTDSFIILQCGYASNITIPYSVCSELLSILGAEK